MKNEIVIVDTEYTTWEGAMESDWGEDWMHREMVQIAAIKFDLSTSEETGVFDMLVKPQINPQLSDYFTDLTGITQEQVEQHGVDYVEALEKFIAFCRDNDGSRIMSYGRDDKIFIENCALNNIDYPFTEAFTNMRLFMAGMGYNHREYHSGDLHLLTDTPLEGEAHNALHDVRSIATFIRYQMKQGRSNIINPPQRRSMP